MKAQAHSASRSPPIRRNALRLSALQRSLAARRQARAAASMIASAIEPVLAVEVRDVAGLAEPVDAERDDRVARHRAEPGQRRRVAVRDGDQRRARPQPRQQTFGDARSRPVRSESCQSRYSDPGEVTASSPAPGTSSAIASCAASASGATAPQ